MQEVQLRELKGAECQKLRPLWEEVFSEDSKEFTDYYFARKAVQNHGFALYGQEGARAMLYLAPYQMQLRVGEGWECRSIHYIVGVATKQEYRHRGYMDCLLRTSLHEMYQMGQPFAFLMPASPEIYQPYQFTYIYDREEYEIQNTAMVPEWMKEQEIPKLTEFAQDWLTRHCDVFIRRDEEYYKVLIKELEAQRGGICLLENDARGDGIDGYFLYAEEEGGFIQEAVWEERAAAALPFEKKPAKKPIIMARIVNVKEMLELLRTSGEPLEIRLRIEDPIVAENEGSWKCSWSKHGAQVQKEPEGVPQEADWCLKTGIEDLTAWVFGYKETEACFETDTDKRKAMQAVKTLNRVFINEIV